MLLKFSPARLSAWWSNFIEYMMPCFMFNSLAFIVPQSSMNSYKKIQEGFFRPKAYIDFSDQSIYWLMQAYIERQCKSDIRNHKHSMNNKKAYWWSIKFQTRDYLHLKRRKIEMMIRRLCFCRQWEMIKNIICYPQHGEIQCKKSEENAPHSLRPRRTYYVKWTVPSHWQRLRSVEICLHV